MNPTPIFDRLVADLTRADRRHVWRELACVLLLAVVLALAVLAVVAS